MDGRPPIPLEYSSVADERTRAEERERRRRQALDNYNESTYGARHPIARVFVGVGIWLLAITVANLISIEWMGRWFDQVGGFLLTVAFLSVYFVVYRGRRR